MRSIIDLWHREVGDLSPRIFAHRVGASEDLVMRLAIDKKLNWHKGCVNTVSFNADGDILVSGSDDKMVMLWDWDAGVTKLSFHSGHTYNVFQARIMPLTGDRTIVTSAADGQVRHARIGEGGHVVTKMLAQHAGRAYKMAIEPCSPHIFYSCGEDGLVQHFDLRSESATRLFYCNSYRDKLTYTKIVMLRAIAIDPRNPNLLVIAGSDEYARVYDIRKYKLDGSTDFGHPTNCFCPLHLIGKEGAEISGLAFSDQSELLASYNDELIYLFTREHGLGPHPLPPSVVSEMDIDAGVGSSFGSVLPHPNVSPGPRVYEGHRNSYTVKGVSFLGPRCEYVASGSDCGRLFIWRKKDGKLLRVMEGDKHVVNCIEPHPYAMMIASSGFESSIKIWSPNATEPARPVNLRKVMMPGGIDCFQIDLTDSDYGNDNHNDHSKVFDSFVDDDSSMVVDVWLLA